MEKLFDVCCGLFRRVTATTPICPERQDLDFSEASSGSVPRRDVSSRLQTVATLATARDTDSSQSRSWRPAHIVFDLYVGHFLVPELIEGDIVLMDNMKFRNHLKTKSNSNILLLGQAAVSEHSASELELRQVVFAPPLVSYQQPPSFG